MTAAPQVDIEELARSRFVRLSDVEPEHVAQDVEHPRNSAESEPRITEEFQCEVNKVILGLDSGNGAHPRSFFPQFGDRALGYFLVPISFFRQSPFIFPELTGFCPSGSGLRPPRTTAV